MKTSMCLSYFMMTITMMMTTITIRASTMRITTTTTTTTELLSEFSSDSPGLEGVETEDSFIVNHKHKKIVKVTMNHLFCEKMLNVKNVAHYELELCEKKLTIAELQTPDWS